MPTNNLDSLMSGFFKRDYAALLAFNFHDPQSLGALLKSLPAGADGDQAVRDLKSLQRALRLARPRGAGRPRDARPAPPRGIDAASAQVLLESGMDSAHKITLLSQSQFAATVGPKLGGDGAAKAKQIYANAVDLKTRSMHLYANTASLTAAPHFQTMAVNHIPPATGDFFKSLPGYEENFGSLDYCECSECRSLFGAAAYLVDLLRVIDKAVTVPNTSRADAGRNIPEGMTLSERRPDLASIPLTCDKTNTPVPYLQIVNEILEGTVSRDSPGGDAYQLLAESFYPPALPFNRPLQEIRALLAVAGTSLAEIYQSLDPRTDAGVEASREYLNLSAEELANLKPPAPAQLSAVLAGNYGLPVTDADLQGLNRLDTFMAQTGLSRQEVAGLLSQGLSARELFDVSGTYKTSDGWTVILQQTGEQVTGRYGLPSELEDSRVEGVATGNVVRGFWKSDVGGNHTAGSFEFDFSADAAGFTGEWSYDGGSTFKWSGKRTGDAPAPQGHIPHQLFINQTLDAGQYLRLGLNQDDPQQPYEQIVNQSASTLDRLNRFTRLARKLGWSYGDLDWVLATLGASDAAGPGANEITDSKVIELAKIARLINRHGLPLQILTALWADLKTTGEGTGDAPASPFDLIFNSPERVRRTPGAKVYHPKANPSAPGFVSPLYRDDPVRWEVAGAPGQTVAAADAPGDDERRQAKVIVSGIPATDDDLASIASGVFGAAGSIELDVANLSALYRHAVLPRQLGMAVAEYLVLLRLLGLFESGRTTLARSLTRDHVLLVAETVGWLRDAGLSAYDLDYVCNAAPSPYVNPGYDPARLDAFIASLQPAMADVLVRPDAFQHQGITAESSANSFHALVSSGHLDSAGIVLDTTAPNALKQLPDTSALALKQILDTNVAPIPSGDEQLKYILARLNRQQDEQASRFAGQLAAFFRVRSDLMAVLIAGVSDFLEEPSYLRLFVQSAVLDVKPKTAPGVTARQFVGVISQYLKLAQSLNLSAAEAASVFRCPEAFDIDSAAKPPRLTPGGVRRIYEFKRLVRTFDDKNDGLLSYLAPVDDPDAAGHAPPSAALQGVTGWDAAQCDFLRAKLFGAGEAARSVAAVVRLKQAFDIARALGVDVFTLDAVGSLRSAPADAGNWPAYLNTSALLRQALKAKTPAAAWPATSARLDNALNEQRRDALLPFALWRLGLRDTRTLYELLLIDVDTSGCAQISYVKEALNAAQLYLQRCRLNLEPNVVISKDDLPDVEWEWLMNYRVWEANRKVFLYPENYLDPSLRTAKTALFRNLENTLLQGEVTKERVEEAYRTYLDEFAQLARLKYVAAYHCTVHDERRGAVDTLFLFARTQEEPYSFYYITREAGDVWSEWVKIDTAINAKSITPVYAFSRLFVFWVELKQLKQQDVGVDSKGATTKATVTKATIKYSFYNFNGKWVQPQSVLTDYVIKIDAPDLYAPFKPEFFDLDYEFWHKVAVTTVLPQSYADGTTPDTSEKIVIFYGPQIDPSQDPYIKDPPADAKSPDTKKDTADVFSFKSMISSAYEACKTSLGSCSLIHPLVLNVELEGDFLFKRSENIVLPGDLDSPVNYDKTLSMPPTFIAALSGTKLTATYWINALYRDYMEGMGLSNLPAQPAPKSSSSLTLFAQAAPQKAVVIPVQNQPGWSLFTNNSETFLLEGSNPAGALDSHDWTLPKLNESVLVGRSTAWTDLRYRIGDNLDALFVTGDIDQAQAIEIVTMLSRDINPPLIDANRHRFFTSYDVQSMTAQYLVDNSQKYMTSALTASQAQAVLDVLKCATRRTFDKLTFKTWRLTTSAVHNLSRKLFTEGIDGLLSLDSQQPPKEAALPFGRLGPGAQIQPPPEEFGDQVSFGGPYGNYFWELFFHGPVLVAELLNNNQQFADAQKWLRYVFDPTAPPEPLTPESFVTRDIDSKTSASVYAALAAARQPPLLDDQGNATDEILQKTPDELQSLARLDDAHKTQEVRNVLLAHHLAHPNGRYWRFLPFRNRTPESLKDQLGNPAEVAAYDEHPFDPHAVARLRAGAYERAVVMQYIDNLLDWGDYEFSRYTWETITSATMLYAYAYDLLGPRPQDLGPCRDSAPASYSDIRDRYAGAPGGVPQFLLELEGAAGGGQPAGGGAALAAGAPLNDLDSYFCVPENDQFTAYWDRVEDRLYKIRHCLNLAGQEQPLPLFEPPVDPMALVRAAAAGSGTPDVLAHVQPDIPAYRFRYLIERARRAADVLVELGAALLSALEKNDAEALALLRSTREQAVLNLTTQIKQKQIESLEAELSALQQSQASAQYRHDSYQELIDGGYSPAERANMTLMAETLPMQALAAGIRGISIAGYLSPNIFGLADGGMQFGEAINTGASIAEGVGAMLNQRAELVGTLAQLQRRADDWKYQRRLAKYDIDQIANQAAATQARIDLSKQELLTHTRTVADAKEEDDFLRSKFTNRDLYLWMVSRVSSVYFQTYRLALEMALAAQAAYQYELDRDDQFVTYAYWDSLHQGLLAGEGLALSLNQLEQSYLTSNPRRLEIEKTISLRQQFPKEFMGFRWGHQAGATKGEISFTLDQSMFDFDFPGHYCRKIKSVSVTIPAVVGPYQNLNATLTQTHNSIVLKPSAEAVSYLLGQRPQPAGGGATGQTNGGPAAAPGGTLRTDWVPNQQVAITRGVDDAGLFVLDFNDDRYLPFEGTGAVSSWTLKMPPRTNRINFDSISDIIVRVYYTALDGGEKFATDVQNIYAQPGQGEANRPQFLSGKVFDLKQAFPAAWSQMFDAPPGGDRQQIIFPLTDDFVLPNLEGVTLVSLLLQLEVAGGQSISEDALLNFRLANQPEPQPIKVADNFGELSQISGAPAYPFGNAQCVLAFNLNNAPDPILKDGKKELDPQKLLNMTLVLCFTNNPFEPSP